MDFNKLKAGEISERNLRFPILWISLVAPFFPVDNSVDTIVSRNNFCLQVFFL